VLKLFAQNLKDVCREYDYVARMGGENLLLVLPGLPPMRVYAHLQLMSWLKRWPEVTGEGHSFAERGAEPLPGDGLDAEQLLPKRTGACTS